MSTTPKIANKILRIFLSRSDYLEKSGDLEEAYYSLQEDVGTLKARFWYWAQVVKTIPICILNTALWRILMFKNYIKVAFRNMNNDKGYSFINISGLAIGMACCILIFLWVSDELSFDKFHENLDRLYRIKVSAEGEGWWQSSPWALLSVLKHDFPEIEKGSWYSLRTLMVKIDDRMYNEKCALVAPDFPEMFSFPFIKGNPGTALSDINSIVLTEETAAKYFGDEDPVGKTIHFNSRVDLVVTGVIENVPANSHMQFDLLTHPVHHYGEARLKVWSMDCPSYVLLKSNVNADELGEKIVNIINKQHPETTRKYYIGLQPLKDIHLRALNGTDPIMYVYLFSIIAVIILFIACINFMNLSTARSIKRAKEVGMRKVVGASRIEIIGQFFGESIILSFAAMCFALLLVYLFLPVFNTLASKQIELDFISNFSLLFIFAGITLFTGIISGSYPALYLSGFQPITVIKNAAVKGQRGNSIRKALIIFQFSAAIILIISTMVIFRQMQYIQNRDLGLNREQVISIPISREFRAKYEVIKERVLALQNVSNVTAASSIPLGISNNNPFYWEGRGPEQYQSMNFVCVDYDYFETFEMKMAYGRSFSKEFPTDRQNYIINEAALKLTGYENPIGRMFSMWTDEGKLIGVVKDFHGTSLHNEIRPIGFMLYENLPYFYMFVKIHPQNIPGTINDIKSIVHQTVPDYVFEYSFLDEYFNRLYIREARLQTILKYFTALAIFISCLGLLGLAAFMAEQRTKEIAIRKVLGARSTSLIGLLSREFLLLVGIANLIAWPVSYYFTTKWMQGYAFHANIGWWIFILSGFTALVLALGTVNFRILKAAAANPVDSLRCE